MAGIVGTRLGPYDITAQIGVGGMGEVYRARDTKLNRDVALKILPEAFTADPDRLARFKREAHVLASLNHPNIAAIYGLEESESVHALVLELVDGPTLADRIAAARIPIEEALPVAKQIVEALEAAHEQAIIHRDLKPANIKLRPDATVKLLDFGLAKAIEPASGPAPGITASPTLTSPAMTQMGVILGTAAYMSPEQAKGRSADKRSDVWAFGCVLYEMLTGTRAFGGDDMSDTLATVLKGQPDWNALPAETPSAIRRLLRRALEKDPKHRLSDIADARLEIEEALSTASDTDEHIATAPGAPGPWARVLPWSAAAVLGITLLVSIAVWKPWIVAPVPWSQRLSVDLGAGASMRPGASMALAISPDGRFVAFVGEREGVRHLYLRRLGELQPVSLVTGGVDGPFFSPDSQWVGFFSLTDRKLKKISVTGGTAVPICDIFETTTRGASWGMDGYIVFNPSPVRGGLLRVPADGGQAESLSTLNGEEAAHRWPQILPDGKSVLFTAVVTMSGVDDARIVVQPIPSGPSKVVLRGAYFGRYLRSGHLLYMQESTLFAVPFDLARLEVTGQPAAVVQGVQSAAEGASSWFDVSNDGTLVYVPGQRANNDVLLQWMGRDGVTTPMRDLPSDWRNPQFAPDGKRLALGIQEGGQTDLWVYEFASGAMTRLTVDRGQDTSPVWSPDGRSIVFASDRGTNRTLNLYWQSADGSGEAHRLTESDNNQRPSSWHPSGRHVAFQEVTKDGQNNIMILPIEPSGNDWKAGTPTTFLKQDKLNAANGMFSPDGRWLAYQSNESGRVEVFVRPFPGPGGRWQVSTSGGQIPTWSHRRSELLFDSVPDNRLMILSYAADGSAFRANPPQRWSEQAIQLRPGNRGFDLHPDGDRVVVSATREASGMPDKVILVTNFINELRRVTTTSR